MRCITNHEFLEIVNNPNELLMVVRLHQLMDGLVADLIEEKLIEKHHLELRRIPCSVRIELAQAMGLLQEGDRGTLLDWSPFLRQTVRTHFSSNGELGHGIVTQAVHAGV